MYSVSRQTSSAVQKMKFKENEVKDFFSKYDQIRRTPYLVIFTEEIHNGKLNFLCSVI